VKNNIFYFRK